MGYELQDILQKCTKEDIDFFIKTIDSYVNFSDDAGLKKLYSQWNSGQIPANLSKKLEIEIRYIGSNDIAYAIRKASGVEPAGVSVHEIIADIAKVQKITIKQTPSIETKLEYLVKAMVDKKVSSLSPEEQVKFLKDLKVDDSLVDKIKGRLKNNPALLLPLLIEFIGPKATMSIMQSVAITIVAQFVGKQAATELIKQAMLRSPWLAASLGPISWIISGTWVAFDLSGPAMRKTLPILTLLGIICLRDGAEDPETFFS